MDLEVFPGEFMDGRTAAVYKVRLGLDLGGVRIADEEEGTPVDLWPYAGLEVDALSEGMVHLRHRHRAGALITSAAPGLARALEARGARPSALPRGGRRARLILVYALAIAAVVAAVYAALPGVSRALAHRVPLDVEARLVLPVRDLLDAHVCRDEPSRRALDNLVRRLGTEPGDPAAGGVRLDVLNFKMVNALTFPGGTVVLTRGLLRKAETADEVAAVVAHELEHVRQRHIMTQIIRSSILSLGWAVTVGDFSGLMVLDPQTMFQLANQRFSRDAERSADGGALERLDRARISARGFAAFFQRLLDEHGDVPTWLSTHPAHRERLDRIGEHVARESGDAPRVPALDAADFAALKAACAGRPEQEGTLGKVLGDEEGD
jgi:predicted Zn-dependent protease